MLTGHPADVIIDLVELGPRLLGDVGRGIERARRGLRVPDDDGDAHLDQFRATA